MTAIKKGSTKETILLKSDGGLDFFRYVMPELEMDTDETFKNVLNPFYKDTNPSLSVYFNKDSERWMFYDHGNKDYKGDVFTFAAFYYELDVKKDFYKILTLMAADLGIEIDRNETNDNVINIFGFKLRYTGKDGYEDSYQYFKQFGITEAVLRQYKVRAINYCQYLTKAGESKFSYFKDAEVVIAYEDIYFSKIYCPDPKRFFYVGTKEKDFVFGLKQIFNRANIAKGFPDTLILTGGEKDVLTLTTLGYDAISLNSETAAVPQKLTGDLFHAYKKIIILYDNDETGKRRADEIMEQLQERFNISVCTLPEDLREVGGKDISDYMMLGLPVDELHQLISAVGIQQSSAVANHSEISLEEASEPSNTITVIDQETPVLPDWVFQNLPKFLKEVTLQFNDPRERDLVLLSTLGVTSSCFPKVRSRYGHRKVAANIYLFISAAASAGKGVMMFARDLGVKIQDFLNEQHKKSYKKYIADMAFYQENVRENPDLDKPEKPQPKAMFIPANTSTSKMIQLLGANENFGVIFESEGDTLAEALKTEWSNFSTVLRKAAHHETISMARKKDDEFIEINNPCLSVVLSGTPNQIGELVTSVENGLVSRFCFYDFKSKIGWKNQFEDDGTDDREAFFTEAAEYMLKLWERQNVSGETIIRMPERYADRITDFFSANLEAMYKSHGDDIVASVRRHGLIAHRIAMLLTIFRNLENSEWVPAELYIAEQDVDIALLITETLFLHLVKVFKRIEGGAILSKLNSRQRGLLESLPDAFSKKQYTEIRKELGIKDDVAEKYIRDFIKKEAINRIDQGQYRKAA